MANEILCCRPLANHVLRFCLTLHGKNKVWYLHVVKNNYKYRLITLAYPFPLLVILGRYGCVILKLPLRLGNLVTNIGLHRVLLCSRTYIHLVVTAKGLHWNATFLHKTHFVVGYRFLKPTAVFLKEARIEVLVRKVRVLLKSRLCFRTFQGV